MIAREPRKAGTADNQSGVVALTTLLDEWTAGGVITPSQARRMATGRVGVRVRVSDARASVLVEGLAYLGGVLVLCACGLLAARWWPDLPTAWRMALVGGPAVVLVLAGTAVPASFGPAGTRLRVALWLGGAVGAGGFLAVLGQSLDLDQLWSTALFAAGTAVVGLVLWRASGAVLLQLLTLASVMLLAVTSTAELADGPAAPGVSAWLVAVGWFVLSLTEPADAAQVVRPAAAAGAIAAAISTTASDPGIVFTLLTVAACLTVALLRRELALLAVGALGLLLLLPVVSTTWFPDTVGAPVAMLVIGLVTVAAALLAARRIVHRDRPP